MRNLIFLLLISSCATPLKHKYSSSKRYLASLTSESDYPSRIEVELKYFEDDKKHFASGFDSIFLHVKLLDSEGNVLTGVDPADLTLSTSEDLSAKPFAKKQGIYKAELLPFVKSKSILMQVDWRERIFSEQFQLETTIAPLKKNLKPLVRDYVEARPVGDAEITVSSGSSIPRTLTEGFNFERIPMKNVSRSFHFDYLEQASQNIEFQIDDAADGTVSHTMHSLFMIFPRKQLPIIETHEMSKTIVVTLANGEKIVFGKESKRIQSGVFEEGPIDRNVDFKKRTFPDLKYKGKGVLIRANARGTSPQFTSGTKFEEEIDNEFGVRGAKKVLVINGETGERCRLGKADFWEQEDVSPVAFKFPTDEELDVFLKEKCGFGLPKL